jgi:hypothetical protein
LPENTTGGSNPGDNTPSQSEDNSAQSSQPQSNGTTDNTSNTSSQQQQSTNQSTSQDQQPESSDENQESDQDAPDQSTGPTDAGTNGSTPSTTSTSDQTPSDTDGGPTPIPITWPQGPSTSTPDSNGPTNGPDPTNNNAGQNPLPQGIDPAPAIGMPGYPSLLPPPSSALQNLPQAGDPAYLLVAGCVGLSEGYNDGWSDGAGGAANSSEIAPDPVDTLLPGTPREAQAWTTKYAAAWYNGYQIGYNWGAAYTRIMNDAMAGAQPNMADVLIVEKSAQDYMAQINAQGCTNYMLPIPAFAPPAPPSSSSQSPSSPSPSSSSDSSTPSSSDSPSDGS